MAIDSSFGGKWLDLLKEIAPHVSRVAVFRNNTNPAGVAITSSFAFVFIGLALGL
jgi:hypothetical protein